MDRSLAHLQDYFKAQKGAALALKTDKVNNVSQYGFTRREDKLESVFEFSPFGRLLQELVDYLPALRKIFGRERASDRRTAVFRFYRHTVKMRDQRTGFKPLLPLVTYRRN